MMDEKQVLAQIPYGILVLDDKEEICFANEWILKFSGFKMDQLSGRSVTTFLSDETTGKQKTQFLPPVDHLPVSPANQHKAFLHSRAGDLKPIYIVIHDATGRGYRYLSVCNIPFPTVENDPAVSGIETRDHYFRLVGKSPKMQEIYNFIEMASATDANVVIQGESGTGKELVASAIHLGSVRREKPFVRVNCAALTETLLESELFGHAKGAFTGAYRDHIGKFEYAGGGTIFLDEIGEISPGMQAKLLRVLQERVVVHVGDNLEIKVDVRVIVATNRNLRSLVTKGKFREDLFYRLNVFPINIPPLRERCTDVPMLIQHFIDKFRERTAKQITSCSPDALRILLAYCWPGNVRELENAIEHAFVLCRKNAIQAADLPHELRIAAVREGICAEKAAGLVEQTIHPAPARVSAPGNRLSLTREALESELGRHNGNKAATARTLGISKVGLWKKMKKLGMM